MQTGSEESPLTQAVSTPAFKTPFGNRAGRLIAMAVGMLQQAKGNRKATNETKRLSCQGSYCCSHYIRQTDRTQRCTSNWIIDPVPGSKPARAS